MAGRNSPGTPAGRPGQAPAAATGSVMAPTLSPMVAVSLSAARRAWPMPGRLGAAAVASWSCCGTVLVPAEGPDAASGAWGAAWSRAGPVWSCEDRTGDRGAAGPGVRLPGGSAAMPASARSMWASAVPMARTRTGHDDGARNRDGGQEREPDAGTDVRAAQGRLRATRQGLVQPDDRQVALTARCDQPLPVLTSPPAACRKP